MQQSDWACIQWRHRKPVTVLTTTHYATDEDVCQRRVRDRETGHHELVNVRRPVAIKYYNKFMGGVDISNQMIS